MRRSGDDATGVLIAALLFRALDDNWRLRILDAHGNSKLEVLGDSVYRYEQARASLENKLPHIQWNGAGSPPWTRPGASC